MGDMQKQNHESSSLGNTQATIGVWLFYTIAAIGTAISFVIWYAFVVQSNAHVSEIVRLDREHIASDVSYQFQRRILTLQHLAKHLGEGKGSAENNWQDIVEYTQSYGGFYAIAWLDASGHLLRVFPANNQLSSQSIAKIHINFNELKASRSSWLSPPIDIQPNKKGCLIIVPTFSQNQKSYLVSVVDFSQAFHIHVDAKNFVLAIYYDGQPVYQNVSSFSPGSLMATDITFDGALWKVYLQPSETFLSHVKSHLSSYILLLGIIIALLFAMTTRLMLIAEQHAKALDLSNQNLQKAITERTQTEETKQKLEKALLQGQKLQAIGTLAGGIAHDFNNLLYAIIGYAEMAEEDTPKDSQLHRNIGKIVEGARRGQELVSRILAFGRRQHLELKPIPLKTTIDGVLALLKPTIPASVTLNAAMSIPDDFMILGDQTRIHQVLVNIINNAVDAMDGEGTVTIDVNEISSQDVLLQQFPEITGGKYVKIEISDTGHGMDQSTIERIFEPFFTTKEVGKGTGLGLATVHSIVKEHRGEVLVTSQLGHGTTFIILLPEYALTS
jgi:signal transduction histidine kinase